MTKAERAAIADYERAHPNPMGLSEVSAAQIDAWLDGLHSAIARAPAAAAPPAPTEAPGPRSASPAVAPARAAATAEARQVVELCLTADRADLMVSCIGLTVDQARQKIAIAGWDRAFAKVHAAGDATGSTVHRGQLPEKRIGATAGTQDPASGWDSALAAARRG
jgi:hypothetical protein